MINWPQQMRFLECCLNQRNQAVSLCAAKITFEQMTWRTKMQVAVYCFLTLMAVLAYSFPWPPSSFQDRNIHTGLGWGTAKDLSWKYRENKVLLNSLQPWCISKVLCFMLHSVITDPWRHHTLCVLPFQTVNILPTSSEYINLWNILTVVPF